MIAQSIVVIAAIVPISRRPVQVAHLQLEPQMCLESGQIIGQMFQPQKPVTSNFTGMRMYISLSLKNVLQDLMSSVQCQLCPMTFSDQSAISAHYNTVHVRSNTRAPPPPRPEHPDAKYPCDICGRKFVAKRKVKLHQAAVHGVGDVKTFQCNECWKIFKRKGDLKRHLLRIHGLANV